MNNEHGGGADREPDPPADPLAVGRAILIRQLTAGPRTRAQLHEAMRKRHVPEDVIDALLERFAEIGLVDDAEFARGWVRSRTESRSLARGALKRELELKGVDPELVVATLSEIDPGDERARGAELARKKARTVQGLPREKQERRLAGMLMRRGYSPGLSFSIVSEVLEEEGGEYDAAGADGILLNDGLDSGDDGFH